MVKKDNQEIGGLLIATAEKIETASFSDAVKMMQEYVERNPEQVDERMMAEIKLIEQMIGYRSMLKEWEYFRTMKLVYRYCEMRYTPILEDTLNATVTELPEKDSIWWCWLQGYEAAPDLIKICYQSLGRLGKRIHIVTADNYSEYIVLPEYIIEKWKAGIISNTHFSDILRLELLTKLGGTWIDSTVLCTAEEQIKRIMDNSKLFCFSYVMRDSINQEILYDNWFLHSTAHSLILQDTKKMLYEFWKNEDSAKHYFIFHLLFTIACRRHPEECKSIPVFSPEPCHVLQHEMMEPFSEERYQQILGMSGIHKLTYKYDQCSELRGTFLEYILERKEYN